MNLFLSYARVDQRYSHRIIELLDAHYVWSDQRLFVGKRWWDEILRQIRRCDGFVYLVSRDSNASIYCQRELAYAIQLKKCIFPILLDSTVSLPSMLDPCSVIDMSRKITPDAVAQLLNAIHVAERQLAQSMNNVIGDSSLDDAPKLKFDPRTLMKDVAFALQNGNYDLGLFLLQSAKQHKFHSSTINIDNMIQETETKLEKQAFEREAKREYEHILSFVENKSTRQIGETAFKIFQEEYPGYDPKNLKANLASTIPLLKWSPIPSGEVTIRYENRRVIYHVDAFRMSKYPITIAQFQYFADADDGYRNADWWNFSPKAIEWRKFYNEPVKPLTLWGDHPRTNVSWYEAMAFCRWLSKQINQEVLLPTEMQWQRAAQGDDKRLYPWGSRFDTTKCNTRETGLEKTTHVSRYKQGASPYGNLDMAGNVWEWCSSTDDEHSSERVIRGGSFLSPSLRVRNAYRESRKANVRYATIGFRVVTN